MLDSKAKGCSLKGDIEMECRLRNRWAACRRLEDSACGKVLALLSAVTLCLGIGGVGSLGADVAGSTEWGESGKTSGYVVSGGAMISDHSNSTQEGSLAWTIKQVGTHYAIVELPGNVTYNLVHALTIPENVLVRFHPGAILRLYDDNVALMGTIEADLWKIIEYRGEGWLDARNSSLERVYPQWWGAKGNGSTDDTLAFQGAGRSGKTVFVPFGSYRISSQVSCIGIIGESGRVPMINLEKAGEIVLQGGEKSRYTHLHDIFFNVSTRNIPVIDIKRSRVQMSGINVAGSPDSNTIGVLFDVSASPQSFHYFTTFYIHGVDYPIVVKGNNFFNANQIGSVSGSYVTHFKDYLTLDVNGSVADNTFGAYLEGGINGIVFEKSYAGNFFEVWNDEVKYLVYAKVDTHGPNAYRLGPLAHYTINPAGNHFTQDIIYSGNGIGLNMKRDYILSTSYNNGWYGFKSDTEDTAIELVGSTYAGESNSWRRAGYVAIKYKEGVAFYDSLAENITGLIEGDHSWFRGDVSVKKSSGMLRIYERYTLADTSQGNIILTLPGAISGRGLALTIKKIASANALIVSANGLEKIDGENSILVQELNGRITLVSDGFNWYRMD